MPTPIFPNGVEMTCGPTSPRKKYASGPAKPGRSDDHQEDGATECLHPDRLILTSCIESGQGRPVDSPKLDSEDEQGRARA